MDLDMPMEGNQKAMMWQNQQYMDSGIQSGATTNAPSISSKHALDDEMDTGNQPAPPQDTSQMMGGGFDFDPSFNQGFTQEQVRIRCRNSMELFVHTEI